MGPVGEASSRSVPAVIAGVLTRDAIVVLYVAVIAAEALVYTVPLLSPGTLTAFGASPFEIPFVAVAALAGFCRLRHIREPEERRFWTYLAAGCAFWMATLVGIAVVPASAWTLAEDVWVDAAYLLFYSPLLFAAECKPHLADPGGRRDTARQLRWAGVTVVVVGWFVYFVVAPVAADRALFGTMLPSSLLFITIDAILIARFAWRTHSADSARWRVLYGTLTLACLALAATDTLDVLEALRVFALPDGATTDLLWAIPPFFFVLAFRLRHADLPRAGEGAQRARSGGAELDEVRVGAFLVGSALVFPVVHFALSLWLPLGVDLERAHQLVVLAELLLLGALTALSYRVLEQRRMSAERTRSALEERIRQARGLQASSRLAGVVAAEYAAAVQPLAAFADRAIDSLGPGDPLRGDAQRAVRYVHRVAEFTNDLRAISRQQRGQPARIDLAEAISDMVPALRDALGPSVRLESAPSREPCVTVIDPAHLRGIALDLAVSARDAMPWGGRCRVETGVVDVDSETALGLAVRPGRFVRMAVRDTREGIPKDVLPHVFEPFYSATRGGRGSGLGLTTVYAIVTQYGGCVTVTSEPGDTTFEVLLPSPG